MTAVLAVSALALIVAGVSLIYVPAGLIVAGALLAALVTAHERGTDTEGR